MTNEQKSVAISKLSSDYGRFCARATDPLKIRAEGAMVREAMREIDPTLPSDEELKCLSAREHIALMMARAPNEFHDPEPEK